MKTRHQCKFVLIIYERPLPANRQLQNLIAIPWFWLNVSLENIKNFFIVIKCVNNWLKYVGKCNYSISVFAVDNGECVHIHCVQNVYSEYKYGEKRGDWSDQRRESWYLEIIDLNMVTITPLSPQLGQWGAQIICLFSLSNQQLLIEKSWSLT